MPCTIPTPNQGFRSSKSRETDPAFCLPSHCIKEQPEAWSTKPEVLPSQAARLQQAGAGQSSCTSQASEKGITHWLLWHRSLQPHCVWPGRLCWSMWAACCQLVDRVTIYSCSHLLSMACTTARWDITSLSHMPRWTCGHQVVHCGVALQLFRDALEVLKMSFASMKTQDAHKDTHKGNIFLTFSLLSLSQGFTYIYIYIYIYIYM